MSGEFSNKTALVIDYGIYPHVAIKLAETFGRVLYFVDWVTSAFPSSERRNVGCGLPDVERVYSWLAVVRDVDLVVCPDVYSWDIVEHCRSLGKPTWGAGRAEGLELERWRTKQLFKSLEMPTVPGELIEGVDALQEFLEEHEDVYVKTSITRGDFETFHHVSWQITKPWLDELRHRLGPRQTHIEFIVEQPVPGIEVGYDGFSVGGRFPFTAAYGYEIKDAGYVGKVCGWTELPDAIRYCNSIIGPTLADLGMAGFYSNEIRIDDERTPYLIDPTMRCGSPPSESYIELFDNWDEVIWAGAHDEMVDLNPVAKFAAQIILKSDWVAADKFLAVSYPEELSQWVKLHNLCFIDEQTYVAPQEFPEFGAAVGLGHTLDEAIDNAKAVVEEIQCLEFRWTEDCFDKARKQIADGRKVGIDF